MFSKLCQCERLPSYHGNESCSLCMSEQAKQAKTTLKQKEATDKAKTGAKSSIPQVSKKQAAINAEKSRIKQRMQAACNVCFTCESAKGETLSHIITAKNKAFELLPLNLVLECCSCHAVFEDNKVVYAAYWPVKWQLKLERAKTISLEHYEKLKQKAE
jgi:hypothetical protein